MFCFLRTKFISSLLSFLFYFRTETSLYPHSLLTSLKALLLLIVGFYPDSLFCWTSASVLPLFILLPDQCIKPPEVLDPVFLSNIDYECCCLYSDMSRASHGSLNNLPRAIFPEGKWLLISLQSSAVLSLEVETHGSLLHPRWDVSWLDPLQVLSCAGFAGNYSWCKFRVQQLCQVQKSLFPL